jgi:peptidylprolyl isomerase
MATSKRERQKAGHRARLAAERRYEERAARRRRLLRVALVVGGIAAAVLLVVVLSTSGDDTTTAASTSTSSTSTAPAVESAAGKPCVAFDDTLPEGAPEVPVPVGDPPTELVSEDLVTGSGEAVELGDTISAQYIGVSCSTGKIFDSSWSRGEALSLPLEETGLIQGWVQGIPGMQPGGRRLLVVPPELGYGSTGSGTIAPDETLVFVIDLESVTPATTAPATP